MKSLFQYSYQFHLSLTTIANDTNYHFQGHFGTFNVILRVYLKEGIGQHIIVTIKICLVFVVIFLVHSVFQQYLFSTSAVLGSLLETRVKIMWTSRHGHCLCVLAIQWIKKKSICRKSSMVINAAVGNISDHVTVTQVEKEIKCISSCGLFGVDK